MYKDFLVLSWYWLGRDYSYLEIYLEFSDKILWSDKILFGPPFLRRKAKMKTTYGHLLPCLPGWTLTGMAMMQTMQVPTVEAGHQKHLRCRSQLPSRRSMRSHVEVVEARGTRPRIWSRKMRRTRHEMQMRRTTRKTTPKPTMSTTMVMKSVRPAVARGNGLRMPHLENPTGWIWRALSMKQHMHPSATCPQKTKKWWSVSKLLAENSRNSVHSLWMIKSSIPG